MTQLTRGGCFALGCNLGFLRSSSDLTQFFEISDVQPGAFTLGFRTKRISKRFRLDDMSPLAVAGKSKLTLEVRYSPTFRRFGFEPSSSKAIGSLFRRRRTE